VTPESFVFGHAASGIPALVVICVLLFAEEAGLPIPFAPGEALLIGAGLLLSSGAVPYLLALPALYGSALLGSLTGFAWARAVGSDRLRRLADRFGVGQGFERVSEQLGGAGALQIAGTRLVPGLRVYTTLVAGVVDVRPRTFIAGVVPAIAVWVAAFTGLGVIVGVPARRVLGTVETLTWRGLLVLAILIGSYLLARRVPRTHAAGIRLRDRARGWRLAGAVVVDLLLVLLATVWLGLVSELLGGSVSDVASAVLVVGTVCLTYVLIARRSVGYTAGEVAFRAHYP
jgi:membrane protein DedA with SNARE-associated domain